MIHTDFCEEYADFISPALLEKTAQMVLLELTPEKEIDLSIVIENDETLKQLNLEYLNIDAPTDVLSFQMNDLDPETKRIYLGDIIISFPRAESQAQAASHPVESELQLLVVHGVLHLLGYDHSEDEEKKKMWEVQASLLNKLDVKLNRLPED
jgi:probable rRNA maturation factor